MRYILLSFVNHFFNLMPRAWTADGEIVFHQSIIRTFEMVRGKLQGLGDMQPLVELLAVLTHPLQVPLSLDRARKVSSGEIVLGMMRKVGVDNGLHPVVGRVRRRVLGPVGQVRFERARQIGRVSATGRGHEHKGEQVPLLRHPVEFGRRDLDVPGIIRIPGHQDRHRDRHHHRALLDCGPHQAPERCPAVGLERDELTHLLHPDRVLPFFIRQQDLETERDQKAGEESRERPPQDVLGRVVDQGHSELQAHFA